MLCPPDPPSYPPLARLRQFPRGHQERRIEFLFSWNVRLQKDLRVPSLPILILASPT